MEQELGLRRIYRLLGKLVAKLLNRFFGVFNPNIITVAGFCIYIIAVGIFATYNRKLTNDISLYIFIAGTQLALILDFSDGFYARMVNRTSQYGRFLDSFSGTIEVIILFGLSYFIAETSIEKWIAVCLTLIYALDQRVKLILISQHKQKSKVQSKKVIDNISAKWSHMIRIPFSFSLIHIYLYMSLWFLFDFIYFLLALYITGLFSVYSRVKLLVRDCPEKSLSAKFKNNHKGK